MTHQPKNSPLTFECGSAFFKIEFTRTYQKVRVGVDDLGVPIMKDSQFPYTTVTLLKDPVPYLIPHKFEIYRTATVGCWHRDKANFTLEKGRIHALRLLSKTMDNEKDLKQALWKTYMDRGR